MAEYEIEMAVRVVAPDLEAAEKLAEDACKAIIEWDWVTMVEAGSPEWRSV